MKPYKDTCIYFTLMKFNDPIYTKKALAETLLCNFYLLILFSWRKIPEGSYSFRYFITS